MATIKLKNKRYEAQLVIVDNETGEKSEPVRIFTMSDKNTVTAALFRYGVQPLQKMESIVKKMFPDEGVLCETQEN